MIPGPENVTDIVKVYNQKTNQTKEASAKYVLKPNERFVYYIQMYVKDYSNLTSNQFVRMVLCEEETKGAGFFRGIKPEDLLKKKDAQEKIKGALSNLLKFNVWLEAGVEITDEGFFLVKATELNEY